MIKLSPMSQQVETKRVQKVRGKFNNKEKVTQDQPTQKTNHQKVVEAVDKDNNLVEEEEDNIQMATIQMREDRELGYADKGHEYPWSADEKYQADKLEKAQDDLLESRGNPNDSLLYFDDR